MGGVMDVSEELSCFVTYATLVLLKLLALGPYTGYLRVTRKVFVNDEDAAAGMMKEKKLTYGDAVVERVRRCHQNDIENILPFFALGLLYALFSGAAPATVVWHYRVFAASRLLHTAVYLNAVRQPFRALTYMTGIAVMVSMAAQLLVNNSWSL